MATMSKSQSRPNTTGKTQEARKAESERRIIRAAIELFAEQGYMRTTLIEIGKAAGYTGGLVTHRFGTKERLLQAVVKSTSSRLLDDQIQPAIESDHASSAEQALINFIDTYFNEVFAWESRMKALYVVMGEALGAVPEIKPAISKINKRARDFIALIVRRGKESAEFRADVDPDASAVLIFGLLRGVVNQYLIDPEVFNRDRILPILKSSAVAGLK